MVPICHTSYQMQRLSMKTRQAIYGIWGTVAGEDGYVEVATTRQDLAGTLLLRFIRG